MFVTDAKDSIKIGNTYQEKERESKQNCKKTVKIFKTI